MNRACLFLLLCCALAILPLCAQTVTYFNGQTDPTIRTAPPAPAPGLTLTMASGSATQSGAIIGSGSVIKTGAGSLTLSGNNTFTGNLTVSAGTLTLSGANASTGSTTISGGTLILNANNLAPTGALTLSNGGSLNLNNHSQTVSSFSGAHTFPLPVGTLGSGTLTINQTTTSSFFGILSNASLIFNGAGGGNLTLTGSFDNPLTTLTVNGGTVTLAKVFFQSDPSGYAIGNNGTALTINNGGTVLLGGDGHDQIYTQSNVVVNSGGSLDLRGNNEGFNNLSGAGSVTNSSAGTTATLTLGENNGSTTVDGSLGESNGGRLALTKTGTGTLALVGANSYTGATTIQGGGIIFSGRSTIRGGDIAGLTASNFTVGAGTTVTFGVGGGSDFTTADFTQLFSLGTGTGGWQSGSTVILYTPFPVQGNFNPLNYQSVQLDAPILNPNGGANVVGVTKYGDGALVLNGINTYTGPTDVENGLVIFTKRNTAQTWGPGSLSVQYGAAAYFNVGGPGEFTAADIAAIGSIPSVAQPGQLVTSGFDNRTFLGLDTTNATGGSFTVTGSLTLGGGTLRVHTLAKLGPGTLVLSGVNDFGWSDIPSFDVPFPFPTGITVFSGTLQFAQRASLMPATLPRPPSVYVISGTVTLNVGGPGEFTSADITTFTTASSNPSYPAAPLGGNAGSTFALDTTNAGASGFLQAGAVFGDSASSAMNFTKLGAGTLTLSGASNFTGVTTVAAGTLALGANQRIANSPLVVAAGATFDLANFSQTVASLEGDGTLALGSGSLTTNGSSSTTFTGVISGAGGSFTKAGAGTLTLTGGNTFTGATTISGGTLALGNLSALGSGAVQIDSGATLNLGSFPFDLGRLSGTGHVTGMGTLNASSASDVTPAIRFDGATNLAKSGTGTLTLALDNTFSGSATLSAGTVVLASTTPLGTGTVLLNGATLLASGGARTLSNDVTFNEDTTLSGSNALTLSGALTLARNRDFTVTNTALTTISGAIGQSGGGRIFAKYGAGELDLTGANTYTGGTFIGEGTVRINNLTGSAFGTGAVTVDSGATLTGAGHFSGALQNNGIYAPGNSPAVVTDVAFSQGSTGTLIMELGGLTRGTQYDALVITGGFAPGGTLSVVLYGGFNPTTAASFDLFDWGAINGTFNSVNLPSLNSGLTWDTSALYTTGVLTITASAIPEPATYAVLAGAVVFGFVATRRRKKTAN